MKSSALEFFLIEEQKMTRRKRRNSLGFNPRFHDSGVNLEFRWMNGKKQAVFRRTGTRTWADFKDNVELTSPEMASATGGSELSDFSEHRYPKSLFF